MLPLVVALPTLGDPMMEGFDFGGVKGDNTPKNSQLFNRVFQAAIKIEGATAPGFQRPPEASRGLVAPR